MKPKILVSREIFDDVLDYLRQHCDVTANQQDKLWDAESLAQALADKDGAMTCLTEKIDAPLLARCPQLKAVCNIAVGYNNIDVPACTQRGIMATNTPGVLDDSTADFTWALILATARRLTEAEAILRAGQWDGWKLKQFLGVDVHHATLGIYGMGRIGQAVARRAAGFEMQVIYHNRNRVAPTIEQACNARYVSEDELLAQSDFLTLHMPYSPVVHHLIGKEQLAKMKKGAILINTARGGVVNDAALIEALQNRTIAAAGLDVFENEPKFNPAFLQLKNVVLAPHIASSSTATRRNMAMLAAKNLVAALSGGVPPNLLNPEVKK